MLYSVALTSYDILLRDRLVDIADAFTVLEVTSDCFVAYLQTSRPASVVHRMLSEFTVRATSMRAMLEFLLLPYLGSTVIATHGSFKTSYGRRIRLSFDEPEAVVDLTGDDAVNDLAAVPDQVIDLTSDEVLPAM